MDKFNKINILFYSNNCRQSQILLSLMNNEKLLKYFHTYCIDNNQKIKNKIKKTPSLMVAGIKRAYIGNDAFQWLSEIKQLKMRAKMNTLNDEQIQYLKQINSNYVIPDDINGFSENEMARISDIFSFYSENTDRDIDQALPQSYFLVENIGKETFVTPPLENGKFKVERRDLSDVEIENLNKRHQMEIHKYINERKQDEENIKQHVNN